MYRFVTAVSVLLLASPALAGDFDSGSNGSDNALDCPALMALDPVNCTACDENCTVQINLASAENGPWDGNDPLHAPGVGVYDPVQWAIVYHYTTINIPAGVTVTFLNHSKGAPVIWLATEDVTIAGSVRLDGADGSNVEGSSPSYAVPGPGGFSGGISRLGGSAGFGPGGGSALGVTGGGGGYGTPGLGIGGGAIYGTASIVPLIGGSGGGARVDGVDWPGGAGGGAILIASSGNISLDSTGGIFAKGGEAVGNLTGSGSGGGIRLIANQISGMGMLRALGGTQANNGGDGRIRVEAEPNGIELDDTGMPLFTTDDMPGPVFPGAPDAPAILRVTAVNGKPVPTDPQATVATDDVVFFSDGLVTIEIEVLNSPDAAGMIVNVRIVQGNGGASINVDSTPLADDGNGVLTATAGFNFDPPGKWEVQLSVLLP